jgi:hypothetical protein
MRAKYLVVMPALFLAGCSFNPFIIEGYDADTTYDVSIVDQRAELSIEGGNEKLLDPVHFLGDEMFVPAKIELLRGALSQVFETPPDEVVLERFDVIDVYPQRLAAAQAAGMASVSYTAAIGMSPGPEDVDFIACVIEADIDGRKVLGSATVEYEISPFAGIVYNDPNYIAAVDEAVKGALVDWTERAARANVDPG